MSEEEELSLKEKVKMMARKHHFFLKDEKEETENGDWYHIFVFEKGILDQKREVEVVFDRFSIVRVDFKKYLSRNCYAEICFYPRMPNIDILLNYEHKHYLIMSIDIKFDIEKILQILFMIDYPEFWVWANNRSSNLTIK